jgi:hypothetical protein
MILRSQLAQVTRWFLSLYEDIRPRRRADGAIFLECFGFITSFGNCSPYITRLLREGSEYLRIRNHNFFTLFMCTS